MKITVLDPGHLSLRAGLTWSDIPNFAVLSGLNGSGKSQLLRAIADQFGPQNRGNPIRTLEIEGIVLRPGDVQFANNEARLASPEASFERVSQSLNEVVGSFSEPINRPITDEGALYRSRRAQILRQRLLSSTDRDPSQIDLNELRNILPFTFALSTSADVQTLCVDLGNVFFTYWMRARDRMADFHETEEIAFVNLGEPPPWETLNKLIRGLGLNFRCTRPTGNAFERFIFAVIDESTKVEIRLDALSSGEKTLVRLAMWILASGLGVVPKLLLLDEPDAHLHASMIPQFVSALRRTLADEIGSRVIMTTHRAETVLSCADGSLFEIRRDSLLISPANQKVLARKMSSSAFTILTDVRCVLVEDEDDAKFYQAVSEILRSSGNLSSDTQLVFQPASARHAKSASSGGRTVVEAWVEKLSQSGLGDLIGGIIDRDNSPNEDQFIYQLNRYSFENYLLDPVVVFALLLDLNRAPKIDGVSAMRPGLEGKAHELPVSVLQAIGNVVLQPIANSLELPEGETHRVSFGTLELEYPNWLRDHRGKDLMQHFRNAYGGPAIINQSKLLSAFRRVSMVPNDLAQTMRKLSERR